MAILNRVPTTELRAGDIVLDHGMRILLGERNERAGEPGYGDPMRGEPLTVVWFSGHVVNYDELLDDNGRVVWPLTGLLGRDRQWTVQGNKLAEWTVERATVKSEGA